MSSFTRLFRKKTPQEKFNDQIIKISNGNLIPLNQLHDIMTEYRGEIDVDSSVNGNHPLSSILFRFLNHHEGLEKGAAQIVEDFLSSKVDLNVILDGDPFWHDNYEFIAKLPDETIQKMTKHDPQTLRRLDADGETFNFKIISDAIMKGPCEKSKSLFHLAQVLHNSGLSLDTTNGDGLTPIQAALKKAAWNSYIIHDMMKNTDTEPDVHRLLKAEYHNLARAENEKDRQKREKRTEIQAEFGAVSSTTQEIIQILQRHKTSRDVIAEVVKASEPNQRSN